MVILIILIILLILSALMIPFTRQLVKDKVELKESPINKKFELVVSIINDALMSGMGEITLFDDDPRLMNLMADNQRNMLIQFFYSTGNLTTTLNYKYFQKELVHKELYPNVRNISLFMQKDIANSFIEIALKKIAEHQAKVTAQDVASISSDSLGISSPADPTSVIADAYGDLSIEQKRSIVNLLCLIAKEGGIKESGMTELSAISQQVLLLGLNWDDCKLQLEKRGESGVVNDLNNMDEGRMSMIALSVMQLVSGLNAPPHNLGVNLDSYVFGIFEKMGYSEKQIEEMLTKIMLMQQMFGL